MLKKVLFVLYVLISGISLNAQFLTDFGKYDPADLMIRECSFDPDADALYLMKEAIADHNDRYNLITEYRIKIKILKEAGLSYANVEIPFYHENDFEFIDNIDAFVYNLNGSNTTVAQLERKNIYRRKLNERWSNVIFTLPAVQVGSVIEYRYRSTQKNYNGLDDWNFQESVPVLKSKYTLTVLPGAEFSYMVHKDDRFPIDIKTDKSSGRVSFLMEKIPGLTDEPYMDARRDYIQRVTFQLSGYTSNSSNIKYMTSWKEVIRQMLLEPAFGGQLKKNLSGTNDFLKEVKLIKDPETRMRNVLSYVRSMISWDGTVGKYSKSIKDAWRDQKGSTADINLSLINLLQSADLEAYPLLVAERQYGRVITDAPFVDQFNKVFAFVLIGNRKFYLNATDYTTPTHIIPSSILNTSALIVDREIGKLVKVTDPERFYKEIITVDADISPDLSVTGMAKIFSHDYARVARLSEYKRDENNYVANTYLKEYPNLLIDSFSINNNDNDTLSLIQYLRFRKPIEASGEYFFIPVNFLAQSGSNPFIAKKRMSNVNFGYLRNLNVTVRLKWPEGFQLDELPRSLQLQSPDKTIYFSREIFSDPGSRIILTRYKFNIASFYPAELYDELKEFYSKMFDILNEQVVMKKIQ